MACHVAEVVRRAVEGHVRSRRRLLTSLKALPILLRLLPRHAWCPGMFRHASHNRLPRPSRRNNSHTKSHATNYTSCEMFHRRQLSLKLYVIVPPCTKLRLSVKRAFFAAAIAAAISAASDEVEPGFVRSTRHDTVLVDRHAYDNLAARVARIVRQRQVAHKTAAAKTLVQLVVAYGVQSPPSPEAVFSLPSRL